MHLAALGATVTGVEIGAENIALCEALAAEHTDYKITFSRASIEEHILALQPNTYDIVLGLSVFHHLVYQHGLRKIQPLVSRLAQHIAVGVFELARNDEPPFWASAQPEDPRALLESYAFVHQLACFPTHLSAIERPLLYASSQAWYTSGFFEKFSAWSKYSQRYVGELFHNTRRYYFSEKNIGKIFRLVGDNAAFNHQEIGREITFLTEYRHVLPDLPRVIASGTSDQEAWLVREQIPGQLLVEAIIAGVAYDPDRVLDDVLTQLCALEKSGIYHGDLRAWNVILRPDGGAALIDFGALRTEPRDCAWPDNLFFAFWAFARGVITRTAIAAPSPSISPTHLPAPYREWATRFWRRPPSAWSFRLLHSDFTEMRTRSGDPSDATALELWMAAIETYLESLSSDQQTLLHAIKEQGAAQSRLAKDIEHCVQRETHDTSP